MLNIGHATEVSKSDYRLGLVMLQDLGHITHIKNLERWLWDDPSVQPTWMHVQPKADDVWQKMPTYSWKISLRARARVLNALRQQDNLDCLFYHTQTLALFSLGIMQRIPTILSLDATPTNFKAIGESYYGYKESTGVVDKLKLEWNRRMFHSAAALVAFSNWVKESLVHDYGVEPDKVTVIPPGVELSMASNCKRGSTKPFLEAFVRWRRLYT